jgi:hypothetical protein
LLKKFNQIIQNENTQIGTRLAMKRVTRFSED